MKLNIIAIALILLSKLAIAQNANAPISLGTGINTTSEEGHPMLSADGKEIYFWRDLFVKTLKEKVQSLWYSKLNDNGVWADAIRLPEPFNIKNKPGSITYISPDNNTIVLKGYFENGERKGPGFSYVNRGPDGFKIPKGIDIEGHDNMDNGKYSGACFLPDGKGLIMYFSEIDGYKNGDLYYASKKPDGTFSEPIYLRFLSTPFDESTPFVASDNRTLYFSSDRKGGLGDQDIWKTTRLDDTWENWTEPINMGPSINTANFDAYFCLDAKAEYGYLTIAGDIVKIKLNDTQKPLPVVLVKGTVYDKVTKKPLAAKVNYENLKTGKNEGLAISDPLTGNYQIALPYGTNYGFNAFANTYLPISDNLDLTKQANYKEITRDLYLVPELVGQVVRINNVFFDVAKSNLKAESFTELNRVANYLKQKPSVKIELGGHTDNVGNDIANFKLSTERAKAVQLYLVKQGVNITRILYKGYGKTLPVSPNTSEENKALNRRVEFTITQL